MSTHHTTMSAPSSSAIARRVAKYGPTAIPPGMEAKVAKASKRAKRKQEAHAKAIKQRQRDAASDAVQFNRKARVTEWGMVFRGDHKHLSRAYLQRMFDCWQHMWGIHRLYVRQAIPHNTHDGFSTHVFVEFRDKVHGKRLVAMYHKRGLRKANDIRRPQGFAQYLERYEDADTLWAINMEAYLTGKEEVPFNMRHPITEPPMYELKVE